MKKGFRTLAFQVTVVAVLSSCATPSPEAFANRFIQAETKAWGTGDLNDLKALESDDVVYHVPYEDLKGWKAHENYIQRGRQMASEQRKNWKYLSGEGNHFIISFESTSFVPANANGSPAFIQGSYLCAFRIRDGKIAEVWMDGGTKTITRG